jgi:hypothetical protein
MSERAFIVRMQANCSTIESWRVRVPADTPNDDELEGVLLDALQANGDFLSEEVGDEHDRTLLDFEEDNEPAPADQGPHVRRLSNEAMAVLAGFAHLDTDQHQYIYAHQDTWDELKRAFPKARFDARCAQDPNFYDPEVWT